MKVIWNLLFLIENEKGEKFGYYLDSKVRNIVDKEYSDKGVVVKKFVNGKLEDI